LSGEEERERRGKESRVGEERERELTLRFAFRFVK